MTLIRGWRCMAMATGAEREPGETQANSTPCAASSSTKVAAKLVVTSIGSSRDSGRWGRQPELLCHRRRTAGHPAARLHPERPELARTYRQDAPGLEVDRARHPRPWRDTDLERGAVLDGRLH